MDDYTVYCEDCDWEGYENQLDKNGYCPRCGSMWVYDDYFYDDDDYYDYEF